MTKRYTVGAFSTYLFFFIKERKMNRWIDVIPYIYILENVSVHKHLFCLFVFKKDNNQKISFQHLYKTGWHWQLGTILSIFLSDSRKLSVPFKSSLNRSVSAWLQKSRVSFYCCAYHDYHCVILMYFVINHRKMIHIVIFASSPANEM